MPGPLCRGEELFDEELFGKEVFAGAAARRPEAVPLPQKRPQEKRHKKAAQLRREVFNLRLRSVVIS